MLPRFDPNLLAEIDNFWRNTPSLSQAQPACSLSVKTAWKNYWGCEEEVMLFAQVNPHDGSLPLTEDWAVLQVEPLRSFLASTAAEKDSFRKVLSLCTLSNNSCETGVWALLHAASPYKYNAFTQPAGLSATFLRQNSSAELAETYQGILPVVPFTANLPELFSDASRVLSSNLAVILMNLGLLVGAEELDDWLQNITRFSDLFATSNPPTTLKEASGIEKECCDTLAKIRSSLSASFGHPLVLSLDASPVWQQPQFQQAAKSLSNVLSSLPIHYAVTRLSALLSSDDGSFDSDTRVVYGFPLGLIAAGTSPQEASFRLAVFHELAAAFVDHQVEENLIEVSLAHQQEAAAWLAMEDIQPLPFEGEVALVTGAASGIGKACAESLLNRGATVIGLDINPAITEVQQHPAYLGLVCDIANEQSVVKCIREAICRFGGLDMLILNAGLFPGGCPIEKMSMAEFTRVLNVNLNANVTLLRETFPYLKLAPNFGRVVIIGSKNVKAPGPGAAAYSASKAAVTQLARVAALEWGTDRIRVNVLHPDAVFDTALYTEDVLQARAVHYGMTVEQYKKRNLLKTEITSHRVAEMAAEMCGPLFNSITGAQIQMDGGNDRTI